MTPGDGTVEPDDMAELTALLDAVALEHAERLASRLVALLALVVRRRVPVRLVEPGPVDHLVRIRFADGTAVLARGRQPGALGLLAVDVLSHQSVCLVVAEQVGDMIAVRFR